jgi:cytochrome c556
MTALLRKEVILAALLTGLVGCGGEPETSPAPGGPGPMAGPGGPPGNPAIKQIMTKLAKGPNSLTEKIGKALNETPPPWETIQTQSKDYVHESGELAKHEPKKGSKESWEKLTAAWIESAGDLDKAAQAKDQAAAKVAHDTLKNSCKECHQAHRTMGPPGGPGGGPRPGGPPPA